LDKLFSHWIGGENTRNGMVFNEIPMLKRLGYTAPEIEKYIQDAEDVSTAT
jgi:hypothetical protein